MLRTFFVLTSQYAPVSVGDPDGQAHPVVNSLGPCDLFSRGAMECLALPELQSDSPVPVAGLSSGVVAVATGQHFSCALTKAGGVMCWDRAVPAISGTTP
jgi:hypothetical protein